jgi:uncharacterized protein (DUF427 family)
MTDDELPAWARAGRTGWTYTGGNRPPFAIAPGPGQESVWDYPRPPLLVADAREVIVRLPDSSGGGSGGRSGGRELARSRSALRLLETSHPPTFYIPRGDVDLTQLRRVPGGGSLCEWKGAATYFDVVASSAGGANLPRAAWSYEQPFADSRALAGHLAFYAHPLACFVGGERVTPQPGGFYGGWITSELVGPFKGDPSTRGW